MKKIQYRRYAWNIIKNFGSDIFLVLIFGYFCIRIYTRTYLCDTYISPDASAYLRQAKNLLAGNGFSYDGLAGYQFWFAWWPILYPAMIAGVALLTGMEVYLASKILAMIIVGAMLLVFRCCFRKDAWVYSLCLLNAGYLELSYASLSETPFMLFLLCFGLVLAKIIKEDKVALRWYLMLGTLGLACFLTRYYGIHVWIVIGLYILILWIGWKREHKKNLLYKAAGLTITAFASGCLCLAYLLMNKIMNGAATGMSRTMWWDDYRTLTNALIESLLQEFFNVFSLKMPEFLERLPYDLKALVVVGFMIGIGWLVVNNCKHFTRESVLITMAVMYDIIFICVRYVSSMDPFTYRFFEPATLLLCVGIIELVLPCLKGKQLFHYFGGMTSALLIFSILAIMKGCGTDSSDTAYAALERQWEESYAEIPNKSVVAFEGIDFGGPYYRADVVVKDIPKENEFEELKDIFYGSDYLCIRIKDANRMIESGEYKESVIDVLIDELQSNQIGNEFIVIPLRTK